MRVALAYGLRPLQIEETVGEKLTAYSDLPMTRETISVGGKGRKGVAVGPFARVARRQRGGSTSDLLLPQRRGRLQVRLEEEARDLKAKGSLISN